MLTIKKSSTKNILLTAVGVVLVAALIIFILEATNTTHLFHESGVPSDKTASEYTKGEPSNAASSTDNNESQQNGSNSQTKNDGTTENIALVTPTGNFVSTHHATANTAEVSTCNTTPGAVCVISFTKDGLTKSLASKQVDAGGGAYWNWKPSDIGLTSGEWTIQVKATLGGQTKIATDALNLTVQ